MGASVRGLDRLRLRFPNYLKGQTRKMHHVAEIIPQLCEQLTIPGLVHRVMDPREKGDVGGYQLNAAALIWRPGTGTRGFHDPVRVPRKPEGGLRTNPFFTEFYRGEIADLKNLEAREHTAQVPGDVREQREEAFELVRLELAIRIELGISGVWQKPWLQLGKTIKHLLFSTVQTH